MGKLFISGDWHGNKKNELTFINKKEFSEQKDLTKEDVLIQLGDFGFLWFYKEYKEGFKKDKNYLEQIANKKFITLVVPGNHENYDLINELPIVEKWGGKVYELKMKKNSIYFAYRGEVYTINDKKIFTFSGAETSSKDERFTLEQHKSGKLYKIKKYKYGEYKKTVFEKIKISKVDYWEQELPTKEEYENAIKQLEKVNYEVDYVCSHTGPKTIIEELIKEKIKINKKEIDFYKTKLNCPVSIFLEEINDKLKFKEWYFGHFHINFEYIQNDKKYICNYKTKPIELIK